MADWDRYRDRLSIIVNEWNKAEHDIKLAEQISNKVVIPSISELRYAGRRLIEAIEKIYDDESEDEINKLLQDAEFDCHRARHDSIDAATATIGVDLKVAVQKVGYEIILKAYPNFSTLMTQLTTIREKIVQSRKNRESREQIYSEMEEREFPDLINAYHVFQTSEPIMKKIALKQRWRNSAFMLFGVVGLIGLIITVFKAFN